MRQITFETHKPCHILCISIFKWFVHVVVYICIVCRCTKWTYLQIREVHKRRYLLRHCALEVFSNDGQSLFLIFHLNQSDKIYQKWVHDVHVHVQQCTAKVHVHKLSIKYTCTCMYAHTCIGCFHWHALLIKIIYWYLILTWILNQDQISSQLSLVKDPSLKNGRYCLWTLTAKFHVIVFFLSYI